MIETAIIFLLMVLGIATVLAIGGLVIKIVDIIKEADRLVAEQKRFAKQRERARLKAALRRRKFYV